MTLFPLHDIALQQLVKIFEHILDNPHEKYESEDQKQISADLLLQAVQ